MAYDRKAVKSLWWPFHINTWSMPPVCLKLVNHPKSPKAHRSSQAESSQYTQAYPVQKYLTETMVAVPVVPLVSLVAFISNTMYGIFLIDDDQISDQIINKSISRDFMGK